GGAVAGSAPFSSARSRKISPRISDSVNFLAPMCTMGLEFSACRRAHPARPQASPPSTPNTRARRWDIIPPLAQGVRPALGIYLASRSEYRANRRARTSLPLSSWRGRPEQRADAPVAPLDFILDAQPLDAIERCWRRGEHRRKRGTAGAGFGRPRKERPLSRAGTDRQHPTTKNLSR